MKSYIATETNKPFFKFADTSTDVQDTTTDVTFTETTFTETDTLCGTTTEMPLAA